jgi:hypothetical protein
MNGASVTQLTDLAADRDRWRRLAQDQRADVRAAVAMVQQTTLLLEALTEREERRPTMTARMIPTIRRLLTEDLEEAQQDIKWSAGGPGGLRQECVDAELAAAEALAEFERWAAFGGVA